MGSYGVTDPNDVTLIQSAWASQQQAQAAVTDGQAQLVLAQAAVTARQGVLTAASAQALSVVNVAIGRSSGGPGTSQAMIVGQPVAQAAATVTSVTVNGDGSLTIGTTP